ncbi:MBL fold metallo-hydrolase [Novosphingobium flavum]|uniref:MBL fold metallo-hydrolase n=1 Tax=Novosphingobium aerophilum TaxID=2839843 RepID=A0A7X1F882_9SPHN|nr:MBL fold metallo-hydrolase [Novosphingobium aerophilum]MBC2652044.1 MBL fold metallo-hydrolase [Novosphingobium aerophilum]MBC2663715.1 MBL fold metallo-hydrolase [Novosphingobium aerophilum]
MKLIMLGCGTSTGVPRIGGADGRGDWGDCDPDEPRNRRSRVSIVVENRAGARLLVDTSPDLRSQLLANGIDKVDAVFWTHDHADHTHGIDDLRPMRYGRGAPIPGYGHEETVRRLRNRFGYVFAGQHGYLTICSIDTLDRLRMCAGFGVRSCQMDHGPAQSTAFRFECDGRSIGYATDFSAINRDMVDLFYGCDLLVVDCLKREPHPTHAHLAMSLELAEACRVKRAVLTHMDRSMDYATLSAEVPPHVLVGYDGLVLEA